MGTMVDVAGQGHWGGATVIPLASNMHLAL